MSVLAHLARFMEPRPGRLPGAFGDGDFDPQAAALARALRAQSRREALALRQAPPTRPISEEERAALNAWIKDTPRRVAEQRAEVNERLKAMSAASGARSLPHSQNGTALGDLPRTLASGAAVARPVPASASKAASPHQVLAAAPAQSSRLGGPIAPDPLYRPMAYRAPAPQGLPVDGDRAARAGQALFNDVLARDRGPGDRRTGGTPGATPKPEALGLRGKQSPDASGASATASGEEPIFDKLPDSPLTHWPVLGHYDLNEKDKDREGAPEYGYVRSGGRQFHGGWDIKAPLGTSVLAAGDGVVVSTSYDEKGYGWQIVVDHGDGVFTHYAHLNGKPRLGAGAKVRAGESLGAVGATGNVPKKGDPHLHFEVRYGSPLSKRLGGDPRDPGGYLPRRRSSRTP